MTQAQERLASLDALIKCVRGWVVLAPAILLAACLHTPNPTSTIDVAMLRSDAMLFPFARFQRGAWHRLTEPAARSAATNWIYFKPRGDSAIGVMVQPPSVELTPHSAQGEWGYLTAFKPVQVRPVDIRYPVGLAANVAIASRFFDSTYEPAIYDSAMSDFTARDTALAARGSADSATVTSSSRSVSASRSYSRIRSVALPNGRVLIHTWILNEYASNATQGECSFMKWYEGWAIQDSGRWRTVKAGVSHTDCDRTGVTPYNPFAFVTLEGVSFVFAEYVGTGGPCRTVLRVEDDSVEDLLRDSC